MLSEIEFSGGELVLVRNNRQVARVTLEATFQIAIEAMSDLYRTLDPDAGLAWEGKISKGRPGRSGPLSGNLGEIRNPWLT